MWSRNVNRKSLFERVGTSNKLGILRTSKSIISKMTAWSNQTAGINFDTPLFWTKLTKVPPSITITFIL